MGVNDRFAAHVGHDFYGLLRFPDDGRTVGALRREPMPSPGVDTLIELELRNGQRWRLYEVAP